MVECDWLIIFSFFAVNISERNVLSFTIDVSSKPKEIEAVSAHLWILMRKRKRGRSRGRKVILRVMKVPNQKDQNFHYLTALRTRVKKTRWQKISLPVTLIQSMLDSEDKALNLRISCKHCGRMVRPVLFRRDNKTLMKNGKVRKRKGGKRRRRRRRMRMRNKRTNENNRIQPFLVISTRYRHSFKQSWDLIYINHCVHKKSENVLGSETQHSFKQAPVSKSEQLLFYLFFFLDLWQLERVRMFFDQ